MVALTLVARGPDKGHDKERNRERLPIPEGVLDVDALIDVLLPQEAAEMDRGAALVRFAEPIERAALASLRTSGGRAAAVLDALGSGDGELLPFVGRGASGPAATASRALVAALEPSIVPLARHPDPALRTKALVLVARSTSDAAVDAVVGGLDDPSEAVQRVALAAVAAPRTDGGRVPASSRAATAVGKVLATHASWALRVLAARAMGRLGAAGIGVEAAPRLGDAAIHDSYALVRQAALEAVASFDTATARTLAARMATTDPEPRVREAARAIATGERPAI